MSKYRTIIFLIALTSVVFRSSAEDLTLNDAKSLYLEGKYEQSLPVFQRELKKTPKNASLNHWLGVCLFKTGNSVAAMPYLEYADKKGIVESPRYLAEIAFYDYRVEDAEEYIEKYRRSLKKSRKDVPQEVVLLEEKLGRMATMLERVERIVIIDSLAVNKSDFFKAYRMTSESGSLNSIELLPDGFSYTQPTVVYMPETKNSMMWAITDTSGVSRLCHSSILSDDQWESPHVVGDILNEGGDANYPFMMQDGMTIYYANNGTSSLGGYDIFISRKDDNEYYKPQNIGMPYNSPYDDYMLAIDETTGVGWWATDRNQLGDSITIYKFIPQDMRINYDVDTIDLVKFARIQDYRSTWNEGDDYSDLLQAIEEIDVNKKIKKHDFSLALPDGRVYTSWSDFKVDDARVIMQQYQQALSDYDNKKKTLEQLRSQYADGNRDCRNEILNLEKELISDRKELLRLRNEIIKTEINN